MSELKGVLKDIRDALSALEGTSPRSGGFKSQVRTLVKQMRRLQAKAESAAAKAKKQKEEEAEVDRIVGEYPWANDPGRRRRAKRKGGKRKSKRGKISSALRAKMRRGQARYRNFIKKHMRKGHTFKQARAAWKRQHPGRDYGF